MSQSSPQTVTEYVQQLAGVDPEKALAIAMQETERQRAAAQAREAEYRAMAEVEFDMQGRIVKANMAGLYRLGQAYARTSQVPENYQNRPDDCFIALQMSMRLGIDPLAYMQNTFVVHGRPGLAAKLGIAMLNESGKIKGPIDFEHSGQGDSRQCTAIAIDAHTGKRVTSTVTWKMVTAEGWNADKKTKTGGTIKSKWNTLPDLMFEYRSAVFLIRTRYPEVMLGIKFVEEIEDEVNGAATLSATDKPSRNLNDLVDKFTPPDPQQGTAAPADEAAQEEAVHEGEQEYVTDQHGEIQEDVQQPPAESEADLTNHDAGILNTLAEQLPALKKMSEITDHKYATVAKCKTERGKKHVEAMCDKRTAELKDAAAAKKAGGQKSLVDTSPEAIGN